MPNMILWYGKLFYDSDVISCVFILSRDFCEECDSTDEENDYFDNVAGEPQIQQRNISPKNAVPSGK